MENFGKIFEGFESFCKKRRIFANIMQGFSLVLAIVFKLVFAAIWTFRSFAKLQKIFDRGFFKKLLFLPMELNVDFVTFFCWVLHSLMRWKVDFSLPWKAWKSRRELFWQLVDFVMAALKCSWRENVKTWSDENWSRLRAQTEHKTFCTKSAKRIFSHLGNLTSPQRFSALKCTVFLSK